MGQILRTVSSLYKQALQMRIDAARAALAAGYRHIDCASMYKNQALVGEGLREFLDSGRRGELFITSKIWNDEHRPDALRRAPMWTPSILAVIVHAVLFCAKSKHAHYAVKLGSDNRLLLAVLSSCSTMRVSAGLKAVLRSSQP